MHYLCTDKPTDLMKMKQRTMLLVCLLTLLTLSLRAEDDTDGMLMQRQENFEQFGKVNPQERVYLHFDNTSYYKGEHIWYKAYLVDGATLSPSPLSRILYVELLNPIGLPVETQKLLVRDGQASGSFLLKDTLNAGFYEVRAYTAWMLNFTPGNGHGWDRLTGILSKEFYGERFQNYLRGNAGIFSRVFPVYEQVDSGRYDRRLMPRLPKATASIAEKPKDRLVMDFYPEGGNLVRGVPSRVAFQARTEEGRTLNIEGQLLRGGKVVGTFKSGHAGRGLFSVITDETDENEDENMRNLQLRVNYDGKNYSFRLPKSQRRGYVLNVFTGDESLRATVARNSLTPGRRLGLSVTSRATTLYHDILDLTGSDRVSVVIDKESLQTGVNIFTLYTEDGKVLAQREVFVNRHDMDSLRLQVDMPEGAETMKPYEKVNLTCTLTDRQGQPVKGVNRFSIAVTDGFYRDSTYADGSMLSYLLLGSELKGFIPHPEYYFEADDHEHRAALDLLMMVQGWTRYDFERMMSGERFQPLMAIERGLNFRGRVVDDHGEYEYIFWKKPSSPLWVYCDLHNSDGNMAQAEIKTDSLGFFMFNLNPFFGTARIALTLNKESAMQIGDLKAGVPGHNFSVFKNKRPSFLLGKHVIPLNQYSPVPRNYDYYETRALMEPIDPNIFRQGFMATLKNTTGLAYYDRQTDSYRLRDVVKTGRRRWNNFNNVKPVAVLDVREMMTYLSNIFGSINDFHFSTFDFEHHYDDFRLVGEDEQKGGWWHPGAERDGIQQNNFADDTFFADMEHYRLQEAPADSTLDASLAQEARRVKSMRTFNRLRTYKQYKFDQAYWSFSNYYKLLMILGLDGMNKTFVDVTDDGYEPVYRQRDRYGRKENLPQGMRFFPADVNFSKLYLYADADDRSLIHQEGNYRELLFHYDREQQRSNDHPLTSIFSFKTDSLYPAGLPSPDFYGYRINCQGLSEPDEFYRVDYSRQPLPEEGDYRRTLYWNPNLYTDKEGRATVTFWNNGFSRSLHVSAEGMTGKGIVSREWGLLNEEMNR